MARSRIILIAIGAVMSAINSPRKVEMTQMPELVAIMHSLVGLAAVFVGFNADMTIAHGRCGQSGRRRRSKASLRELVAKKTPVEIGILKVELVLGIWIGAVTFTGSVIAYGKLAGHVTTAQPQSCRAATC